MRAHVRLGCIVATALVLASLGSHLLVAALGIQTKSATTRKRFGTLTAPAARGFVAGSSITYDAIAWNEIANLLGLAIESWPVPGSSPAEWEQLARRSSGSKTTFVGVSLYDLNEAWLCDFRADLVPLGQTVTDLWHSGSDTAFARRLSISYPRAWARHIFPTTGRSDRVIFGLRDAASNLLRRRRGGDPQAGAPLRLAADYTSDDRISDWPADRLLRRLAAMHGDQGRPWFWGPKHRALRRLLEQSDRRGSVIVIVLPVSAPYAKVLLDQQDIQQFEASLLDARRGTPAAQWLRLDHIEDLRSGDYFYDLVHLNMQGRRIATDYFHHALAGATD